MHTKNTPIFSWLTGIIIVFALTVLLINHYIYQYPGNNYFPPHTLAYALILILIYLGLVCCFGAQSKAARCGLELLYFFSVLLLMALMTSAVQFTPFSPIDQHILSLETSMHINLTGLMSWTNQHLKFKKILLIIYAGLDYEITFFPLIMIVLGQFSLLKEYYFLMLSTLLLGFTFYYFFPTTAPASVIHSSLFAPVQIDTGLKFYEIHHYISPTTLDGGLIATPSFHVIWALLSLHLVRKWRMIFWPLCVITGLLIASCVLLGWHYVIDVIAAFIVVGLCYYSLKRHVNTTRSQILVKDSAFIYESRQALHLNNSN